MYNYVMKYGSNLARDKEYKTIRSYISDVNVFLDWLKERKNIHDEKKLIISVSPEDVEDYLNKGASNRGTTYSLNSVNKKIISLKGFYEYIKRVHRLIDYNPFDGQHYFKKVSKKKNLNNPYYVERPEEKTKDFLTLDEGKNFITQLDIKHVGDRNFEFCSLRNKFLFGLMLTTGLRIDEALTIELSDIDYNDYGIMINITDTKNHKDRRIPISGKVNDYFKEYMTIREKFENEYLFISNRGKKMNPKNVNEIITKYSSYAHIDKHITNHCFRHSCRTWLSANGVNESLICSIGGWTMSNMGDIYNHLDGKEVDIHKIQACDIL